MAEEKDKQILENSRCIDEDITEITECLTNAIEQGDSAVDKNLDKIIEKTKGYPSEKIAELLNELLSICEEHYSDKIKEISEKLLKGLAGYITDKVIRTKLVLKGVFFEHPGKDTNYELVNNLSAFIRDDNKKPDYKKPILIVGPTGTGKELIAKAIHLISDYRDEPFIAINCAAIPETLLDSELFGHEKGAYTGAIKSRPGYLEQVRKGTLFIDEVGEMPLFMQVKLLRVLETKRFRRLGYGEDNKKCVDEKQCNARFVFATNRDLGELIRNNMFRLDFYKRISVFRINMPSLKEQLDKVSIKEREEFFIERILWRMKTYDIIRINGKRIYEKGGILSEKKARKELTPIISKLLNYRWSGNYRELYNVLDRAFAYAIRDNNLTEWMFELDDIVDISNNNTIDLERMSYQEISRRVDEIYFRPKLEMILKKNNYNLHATAIEIGLDIKRSGKQRSRAQINKAINHLIDRLNINNPKRDKK